MKITKELLHNLGYAHKDNYVSLLLELEIPEGYEPGKVGDATRDGSLMWYGEWGTPNQTDFWYSNNCFLIQPVTKKQEKFVCGHGADPTDKFCRVCSIFQRLITDRRS